jgi:hypothetical protein
MVSEINYELKFDFPTCEKLGVGSAFQDRHCLDADPDPDPDWHQNDADPHHCRTARMCAMRI